MKYQTEYAKCDWTGLQGDVSEALKKLQIIWQATEKGMPADMHKQMVENVYAPALQHLAQFCMDINNSVQVSETE